MSPFRSAYGAATTALVKRLMSRSGRALPSDVTC